MIIELLEWFNSTEGGAMPSTIEAAAPYTPLATGNFDRVLSVNDNNLQAAMETIDDHDHTSASTAFALTGDITPAELSGNQNNYNPTGLSTASVIRLTATNDWNITGLAGGTDGRIIVILNVDAGSDTITLKDADAASDAANQFQLISDIPLKPGDGIALIYDSTDSRWRQLSPYKSDAYIVSLINATVPNNGWIAGTGTYSYTSADSPAFVMSVPDADAASINVGDRIKLTQTTSKYFIVHAKGSPSGGFTPVTIYGGTDYTLANAAIASPRFSHAKSPLDFPMDPQKWTVSTVTTDTPTKATPTAATWYGGTGLSPTGPSIDLPIGAWRVFYRAVAEWSDNLAAIANAGCRVTLSTANNSQSDAELTTGFTVTVAISATALQRGTYQAEKLIAVAAKTTYYLNIFTGNSGVDNIYFNPSAVFQNVIKAVCAYL